MEPVEPVGKFADFGDLSREDVRRIIKEHDVHGYEHFALDADMFTKASEVARGFLVFVQSALQNLGILSTAGITSARYMVGKSFDPTVPTDEMLRELWNERARDWAVIESPFSYAITLQTLLEFLRANERVPYERFLSIGSGPGLYETYLGGLLVRLEKPKVSIHCLDVAKEMTECHRRILLGACMPDGQPITNVHAMTGDMLKLPYSAGTIDQIICLNALQWSTDWKAAIAEMARVMRPDGLGWLYLCVFPHPMAVFTAAGKRVLEVGRFGLHELFDELERHRFFIHHCRQVAGREGTGQAGLPLRRIFIQARFQASGDHQSWREKKVSTAITGIPHV